MPFLTDIDLDMADVKPTVLSWIIVGLMAASFIVFAKYVFNRWSLPGRDFVNAV